MARYEEPPFERGSTWFGSAATIDASDLTNIGGEEYEGRQYEVEDNVFSSGTTTRLRVVRNMNATPVYAGDILQRDTTTGMLNKRVNGVTSGIGPCAVADALLPAGGVQQYDLFYVVEEGMASVKNAHTSPATVAAGDAIVPGASGRLALLKTVDAAATFDTLAQAVLHTIGLAVEASNTADDNVQVLVHSHF